jgi:hypothetical protein
MTERHCFVIFAGCSISRGVQQLDSALAAGYDLERPTGHTPFGGGHVRGSQKVNTNHWSQSLS